MTLSNLSADDLLARQRMMQKLWRQNNPEKVKEYYEKHQARPEHRERIKQWHSTKNKEHINAQARERYHLKKERAAGETPLPEVRTESWGDISMFV